jgi:hypothetical protein
MFLNNEELRTSNDNPFNSQKSKIPLSPCKLAGGKSFRFCGLTGSYIKN